MLGSRGYVSKHRDEMPRHVAAVIHDVGDGKVVGYFTNGRPEIDAAVKGYLAPVAASHAAGTNRDAPRGTVPHVRESHESSRLSPITKY